MESHEAMAAAINRGTVRHAKALGLSTSTLNKWQEPCTDFTDSGAYNPLDRIRTIIKTSLEQENAPEAALAPVFYLAQEFNLCVIPLPPHSPCLSDMTKQLFNLVKTFGELIKESSEAVSDGRITPAENKAIDKVGHELLYNLGLFLKQVQETAR